ncbi:DUF1302 domain-containing protein [Amphritea sp.]|uniref:DUF1302 domain-containing protein n=1 Tax=Amphritea sp. TaxID=1872502 RepID=UPI00356B2A76
MTYRNKPGNDFLLRKSLLSKAVSRVVAGSLLLAATQAQALNWQLDNGVVVDLDTTLSYEVGMRLKDQDATVLSAGGNPVVAAVTDDGNRNFDKHDLIKNAVNFNTDLDIQYGSGGAFFRGRGWYDDVYSDDGLAKAEFQRDGLDKQKSEVEILDAFVYNMFDMGERSLSLRAGRQVVSWGESLFIGGGISSAQSPVDATKASAPGVDLKDIFMPVGQVYGEVDLSDSLAMGAYYQWEWEESRIDAPGAYFSVLDVLGQGVAGDNTDIGLPVSVDKPRDGQWGVALRYTAENLNDTEFGFHYLRYNDFLPAIQLLPPLLGPQVTNQYFEDIDLIGVSAGMVIGDTNVGAEISYQDGKAVQVNIPGAFYFAKAKTAQAQVSFIHLFPSSALADSITLYGEFAHNRVLSINDDATAAAAGVNVGDVASAVANDRSASSAVLRAKFSYFSVAPGLDMFWTATYRNDFNGRSSIPFTFTEDFEQLALKADFRYAGGHSFGVSYVNYLSDVDDVVEKRGSLGLAHLNADRDYVSAYYKYRF